MKTFIFIFLISVNANAEQKFLCSALYAKSVAKKVEHYPGSRDKFKHCSVSCMLALRCGATDSYSIGVLKEILDFLGMGTPDAEDIRANKKGIDLVKKKIVSDDEECMIECGSIYP